jgi:hypothetical protein
MPSLLDTPYAMTPGSLLSTGDTTATISPLLITQPDQGQVDQADALADLYRKVIGIPGQLSSYGSHADDSPSLISNHEAGE